MNNVQQTMYILSQKLVNHGLSGSERELLETLWLSRMAELAA